MTFPSLDEKDTSISQGCERGDGRYSPAVSPRGKRSESIKPNQFGGRHSFFAIVDTISTAGTVPLFSIQCVVSLPAVKDTPAAYSLATSPRWSMILPDSTCTTSGRSLWLCAVLEAPGS